MESKLKVAAEIGNVVQVYLIDFDLKVDLDEWIRKGRALQIYLMVWGVSPKTLSNVAPRKEMWARSKSLGGVQHYTNRGCNLTVSRGHYLVVPASSMKFPHKRLNRGVGFSPWEIYWGVNLIKLVTPVAFDASNWLVEPQRCKAYTTEPWLNFNSFIAKFSYLLVPKDLFLGQWPYSRSQRGKFKLERKQDAKKTWKKASCLITTTTKIFFPCG